MQDEAELPSPIPWSSLWWSKSHGRSIVDLYWFRRAYEGPISLSYLFCPYHEGVLKQLNGQHSSVLHALESIGAGLHLVRPIIHQFPALGVFQGAARLQDRNFLSKSSKPFLARSYRDNILTVNKTYSNSRLCCIFFLMKLV